MTTDEIFVFDLIHETTGCICIKCNNKYYPYNDPFIEIIDSKSNKSITYEMCLDCVKLYFNRRCKKCNLLLDEPWDKVSVDFETNTVVCQNKH